MTFSVRAPRVATGLTIALLLVLAGATLAPAASGQPSPGSSPSPSGSAPADGFLEVELLNPSAAYDPTPKVSDRFDGTDTAYTIAARATGSAEGAVVEAYVAMQRSNGTFGNESTIGELTRVNAASDVWQLEWDIPPSQAEGVARITVRAYVATPSGFVETGSDSVEVELFYSDPTRGPIGAWETAELLWPEQDGPLGWYKPRVGAWRVVLTGTTSPGATFVQMFVSTSPAGAPLKFTPCGTAPTAERPGGFRVFQGKCTLSALEFPSKVRAVAVVAELRDEATGLRFMQAADAAAVRSYMVSPEDMSIRIAPATKRAVLPAAFCHDFAAVVTDDLGQLVVGANVDVHASGPGDELTLMSQGLVVPEGHSTEKGQVCPGGPPTPADPPTQADHNVPGGIDAKHMESNQGTGLDTATVPPGQVVFRVVSNDPGFTKLTAWVDDEEIAKETEQRPADNDKLDPGEPVADGRMQWMAAPMTLSFDPLGGTAAADTCFPYTVKARAGTAAVPGINVDVHATGPDDGLDFCDPAGALPRRAPGAGAAPNAHSPEDATESSHFSATGPDSQHTEGETDAAGNFVVGLTSPVAGDTSVTAWVDGEPGADDDVQGGAETAASGTISWATTAAEAELGFVNPSPYGAGTAGPGTGTQLPDSGGTAKILVRVDMAADVPGVEVLLSRDGRKTYDYLGEATRVGATDLYALTWAIDVPDGTYGLRARIVGTTIVEDIDVRVGAGDQAPMIPHPPYESLQLTKPQVAAGVPFSRRATVVSGRASAGAEGVDVFYTKVPAKDTPRPADWIFCGYAGLDGTGAGTQEFSTSCTLTRSDQAAQVTGVAAITFDCTAPGCDANPTPEPPAADVPPPPREQGQKETGQAVRVFGYEAHPLLSLEPAETLAVVDTCRSLTLALRDQTGQPIEDENVDLHLDGAAAGAHFCRPPDGSDLRAPDAGGHAAAGETESSHEGPPGTLHTEGRTLPDGSVVFGVVAASAGDVQLTAWLDRGDDDLQGADEAADTALVHWTEPGGCSIAGSPGPDILRGTRGDDVFCGFEGNDVMKGRGGNDTMRGGSGRDVARGGAGADVLRGGKGRDLLAGGRGRDSCRGGAGRDRLVGCEGRSAAALARRSGV